MSNLIKFADIEQNTPRLVVMFQRSSDAELYQWGMVGEMPILSLVGCITRVQAELPLLEPYDIRQRSCPESALAIVWDAKSREFSWFIHPDIPTDSIIGMLETIKATIIDTSKARQIANQQIVLGPDGLPARRDPRIVR